MRRLLLAASALLLLLDGADAACARGVYNKKICSGYGTCNPQNLCECDARHFGFDCSQKSCPLGPAWVAAARATDDAHYPVECSNRGVCDYEEGSCSCDEGFVGSACQRLECPNACDGAGQCLSLKELSATFAVGSEPLYDSVWDAEMIYGCNCRKGYHAYDCSLRSCPRGDDPLTTGQKNEVQIVQCTATGGSFFLFFNGQGAQVPFNASLSQFQSILASIPNFPQVNVTFGGTAKTVCSSATANAILIEFIYDFGPQPPIKVLGTLKGTSYLTGGSVFATSAGGILAGRTSVQGTKEWEFCSNRGDCNHDTGQCVCFLNPMPGYRSSDGYGNPGTRGDCGCANDKNMYGGPIVSCVGELACSGHGYCTGSPSFKCVCEKGWTTGDCSSRTCPIGPSWFTAPSASNTVHNQWTMCSDVGTCDQTTGQCSCYTPFEGAACEFMKCPGEPACSGHGECMSIRRLSLEADVDSPSLRFDYGADPNNMQTFDRYNILGCKCDPGYEGYDCSKRSCPRGDDPITTGQVDEIQVLRCTASGGVFRLQYRTSTSTDIPFNARASALRHILKTSFGFEDPVVMYSSGIQACSAPASPANIITVTFPVDHGDIPPLRAVTAGLTATGGAVSFITAVNGDAIGGVASQQGTKENAVCSNRGYCDYQQGTCICSFGYGSSDGLGNHGNRDDCGYILPKVNKNSGSRCLRVLSKSSILRGTDRTLHSPGYLTKQMHGTGDDTATLGKVMRRAASALTPSDQPSGQRRESLSRRTLATAEFKRLVACEGAIQPTRGQSESNLKDAISQAKIKLDRALQIKDRCDRELQALCESKRRRYRTLFTLDGHDELVLLEQDKANESMIRDKRELERLMRKLSPAMSHFASTQAEFVHILQGCSVCSNRLAFCAGCADKASEFFNSFTSAELFALYGGDLPPANETEIANFVDAVAAREARAVRNEYADL